MNFLRVVAMLLVVLVALATVTDAAPFGFQRRGFRGSRRGSGKSRVGGGGASRRRFSSGIDVDLINPDPYQDVNSLIYPNVPFFV